MSGPHFEFVFTSKYIRFFTKCTHFLLCFVFSLLEPNQRMLRIDCKGDNSLRIRQIKVTGEVEGESPRILQMPCSFILQQRQCESETLKVFRLIIFQVGINYDDVQFAKW